MTPPRPGARSQERAMLAGCILDTGILVTMLAAAIWGNSLSLVAELMRGVPLLLVEAVLLAVLVRINRGRIGAYDYGTRKIEQFANLLAGLTLVFGAAWLVSKILGRIGVPQDQPALGLAFAAAVACANLGVNAAVLLSLWRAGRDGTSLIMNGQIKVRLSKTIASALVALAVAVNAAAGPEGIGGWADLLGTAIVILVMLAFGGRMVADAMPHLLDRALGEQQQAMINRALAARFEEYDELVAVRTRTEGRDAWIEIELGFDARRPVGDAASAAERIAAEIRGLVPGARVMVAIRAAG